VTHKTDGDVALEAYVAKWVSDHERMMATISRQDYRTTARRRRARIAKRESAKLPGFRNDVPDVDEIVAEYEQWDDPAWWREMLVERYGAAFGREAELQAMVTEMVTTEQAAEIDAIRRGAYPPEPEYGIGYYLRVLCALRWCPEPITDNRIRYWDWLEGKL